MGASPTLPSDRRDRGRTKLCADVVGAQGARGSSVVRLPRGLQLVPDRLYPFRPDPLLHGLHDFRDSARGARHGNVARLPRTHPPLQREELPRQPLCHGHAVALRSGQPRVLQGSRRQRVRRHALGLNAGGRLPDPDVILVVPCLPRAGVRGGEDTETDALLERHARRQ